MMEIQIPDPIIKYKDGSWYVEIHEKNMGHTTSYGPINTFEEASTVRDDINETNELLIELFKWDLIEEIKEN